MFTAAKNHFPASVWGCWSGFAGAALHHFPWISTVACADQRREMHDPCQTCAGQATNAGTLPSSFVSIGRPNLFPQLACFCSVLVINEGSGFRLEAQVSRHRDPRICLNQQRTVPE